MKYNTFNASKGERLMSWIQVTILVVASFVPLLLITQNVQAAQLDNRSIELSDSDGGATGVTYTVQFDAATTASLDGAVVDFCGDSPIIGEACSTPTGFDVSSATLGTQSGTGTSDFTIDAANTTATTLVLDRTAESVSAGTTLTIPLDGVTNPTADNTSFYARILTYDNAGQDSYASQTPGTHVDDGGVALSTAEQITVSARVQERLVFCVGNVNPSANCGSISGSSVDIGVLDSATVNQASVDGDNTNVAHMQLSTNAVNGATVNYYATELQVDGATCSGTDTTDECINEVGTTAATITAGTENWGMNATKVDDDSPGTTNLSIAADYSTADHALVVSSSSTSLASSTSVVDNESMSLDFAATVDATTPTGLYQSTLTFVATGTF